MLNSKFLKYKKSYRKGLKKIYIDRDDWIQIESLLEEF